MDLVKKQEATSQFTRLESRAEKRETQSANFKRKSAVADVALQEDLEVLKKKAMRTSQGKTSNSQVPP